MSINNIISFWGNKCKVHIAQYSNKRIALELLDINDNTSIAIATVNLPNIDLQKDEVAIKNYSENEGILDILINAEIISKPLYSVKSGFIDIPICKLLMI